MLTRDSQDLLVPKGSERGCKSLRDKGKKLLKFFPTRPSDRTPTREAGRIPIPGERRKIYSMFCSTKNNCIDV